jgi:restriction system protein
MPSEKRRPLSEILAGAAASAVSLVRRSSERVYRSRRSAGRSDSDAGKWTPELLKQLEWRRFEQLCAAYFETLGFRTRIVRSAADGSADIHLYGESCEHASMIAQCKAWSAYRIGINPVRELRAAVASASVGKGALLTPGRFTQEAVAFAGRENIQLIDGARLLGELTALSPEKALALLRFATQGDYRTPTCPSCSIKMVTRQSTSGGRKFWGCHNYPHCKQIFWGTENAPA